MQRSFAIVIKVLCFFHTKRFPDVFSIMYCIIFKKIIIYIDTYAHSIYNKSFTFDKTLLMDYNILHKYGLQIKNREGGNVVNQQKCSKSARGFIALCGQ